MRVIILFLPRWKNNCDHIAFEKTQNKYWDLILKRRKKNTLGKKYKINYNFHIHV